MSKTRIIWTFEEIHELNSNNGVNPMEDLRCNRQYKQKRWGSEESKEFDRRAAKNAETFFCLLYNEPREVFAEPWLLEEFEEEDAVEQQMSKKEYKLKGKTYNKMTT